MNPQPTLFDTPQKSGYSYATSKPAYQSNEQGKKRIAEKVYELVKRLGETNLLQISEIMDMPQSSIAGRINNLIDEGRVMYSDKIFYKDYTRKKIVLC